jgi:hypothetical protein
MTTRPAAVKHHNLHLDLIMPYLLPTPLQYGRNRDQPYDRDLDIHQRGVADTAFPNFRSYGSQFYVVLVSEAK